MTSTDQHRSRPSSTLFHTSTCQSPTTRGTSQGWRGRQLGWPARCGVEGRGRCPGSGEESTRWFSPAGPSPSPATGGKEGQSITNWTIDSLAPASWWATLLALMTGSSVLIWQGECLEIVILRLLIIILQNDGQRSLRVSSQHRAQDKPRVLAQHSP